MRANHRPAIKRSPAIKATARGAPHRHNPAGSKLLRRACRFKTGRRVPYKVARAWYISLNDHIEE